MLVDLLPGGYVYVGSALGGGSGLYLPKRLLRHATRTADLPKHACYDKLTDHFASAGVVRQKLVARQPKRLHWNIDYIINQEAADLRSVLYIRSEQRLEFEVCQLLEDRQDTGVPVPGLGAHDHRGHTHFLSIAGDAWPIIVEELLACYRRLEEKDGYSE